MLEKGNFRINRRALLKLIGGLLVLPLAGTWYEMVKRESVRRTIRERKLSFNEIEQGYNYFDDFYIIRDQDRLQVFSMHCTHLGCRLKPPLDGKLTCPCHGSSFDPASGNVISGPAGQPLLKPEFRVEEGFVFIKTD
jgi:Rieske Fe-S protein